MSDCVEKEYIHNFKYELWRAIKSGVQPAINTAFHQASINPRIPREFRAELIGEQLSLLSEINVESAREATRYIVGIPLGGFFAADLLPVN